MINFDAYRHNPNAAATLIAREGDCECCPMYHKCDSAPDHDDYDKCFEMWMRFLKFHSETLGSVDDFSELLSIVIDCDKCTVAKLNECDYSDTKDCRLTFCKWLCKKIPTCQESRQVGLEGLHPDDAKAVEEILEQASNDTVHHPNHYQLVDGIEVIDVIKVILNRSNFTGLQGYYLGNVLKYVLRADMKNGKEDYEKAEVYLDWLIRSMLEEKA